MDNSTLQDSVVSLNALNAALNFNAFACMFTAVLITFTIHLCLKFDDGNWKPIGSFFWLINASLSFYSLVAPPETVTAVLIMSEVFDLSAKASVIAFLYKKFTILEMSCPSLSSSKLAIITRRMPFILASFYVLLGECTGCYLIYTAQTYDIANALYIIFTSSDMALVSLDIYVVFLLYGMKKGNPESKTVMYRIGVVIAIGAGIKAATIILFSTNLDPYWFYYMISFPFSLILYEIINNSWIQMAKMRTAGVVKNPRESSVPETRAIKADGVIQKVNVRESKIKEVA